MLATVLCCCVRPRCILFSGLCIATTHIWLPGLALALPLTALEKEKVFYVAKFLVTPCGLCFCFAGSCGQGNVLLACWHMLVHLGWLATPALWYGPPWSHTPPPSQAEVHRLKDYLPLEKSVLSMHRQQSCGVMQGKRDIQKNGRGRGQFISLSSLEYRGT